jgi:hypothetical protein
LYVEDTVGVEIEGHLNLGDTTGGGGDTGEVKLTQQVVVLGTGSLTLEDLDKHTRLVVSVGGEGGLLLARDGGVAVNQVAHDTTGGLNTERERGHINEKDVLGLIGGVTREDGGLDGGAIGNGLIRVDGLARLLTVEELFNKLLDLGDTGGTANKDDLVDIGLGDLGVAKNLLNRGQTGAEIVVTQVLETSTSERAGEVLTIK